MDLILITKVVIALVLVLLFMLIAYLTRILPVLKLILVNLLMLIIFLVLGYISFWGVDYALKKARLVGPVKQSRNVNQEQLTYYGRVQNVGKYTIKHIYVEAKVVNNVSGKKQSSLRGEGDSTPGSLTHSCVAAVGVRRGETRNFSCRMPYPPGFRLADIHFEVSWD